MKSSFRLFVWLFLALVAAPAARAGGSKPEDVFKGKVVVTANRLPLRFPSAGAFISAVNKARTDRLWPKEEKGDHATWNLEYIAFFASPLNDHEVNVKFYEVTGGGQRYVAGDEQMTRERGTRIFASNITLGTPEFEVNKKYMMTVESGHRVIATTQFWLRGKGANYSGKVEFTDDDVKGK
jgi:hypothetical protein